MNDRPNPESIPLHILSRNVAGKSPDHDFEREFVRRVTLPLGHHTGDDARQFFISDFSTPILQYTARTLRTETDYTELLGEYYIFISKENKGIPYYRVWLYGNINNSSLRHYVSTITLRHFRDKKMRDDKTGRLTTSIGQPAGENNQESVIENPWFNLMICNGDDDDNIITPQQYMKISYVLSKLPKRDSDVLHLMVMDNLSGLEAFEEMKDEIAKTAKTPVSGWTVKQKQNAMALLKGRALEHFKKIVEDEKIDFR